VPEKQGKYLGNDRGLEKIPISSINKIQIKIMIIGADRTTGRIGDTTPFSFSIGSHAPDTYTYLPYKLHSSLNLLFSYRIAGVELITLAVVNARVTDYSHAQYIPVTNGIALVWEQRHVLRHSSILTEFSAMIDETAKLSD